VLQAAPGSTHGYDVVNPNQLSADLGGEEGFARLCDAARQHGLGLLLDIVPNHLAAHPANPWWWDLLKHGRKSAYSPIFDVAWNPPEPRLRGKILLPVLGDHYGRVLEAGELRLERRGEEAVVRYHDQLFPLAPESVPAATPLAAVQADADRLDRLLRRQHYRLAYWRAAARELDYRRFFDITGLVGVRVEDRRVFEATQARVVRWLQDGLADGVRVDHLDGLRDPQGYLEQLRYEAPGAWLVAEKVLLPGEAPPPWLEATTGYEFLNLVLGLFVDPEGEAPLTRLWQEFGGEEPYGEVLHSSQLEVLRGWLGSELARVVHLLLRICELRRRYRDFTRHELHEAVAELVAAFPVYRAYARPGRPPRPEDRAAVEQAVAAAARRRPDLDPELLRFLRDLLLGRFRGRLEAEFLARFQQLTGATLAKGGEDTAFYRYHRLTALNEVGGDPRRFGVSVADFHAANRERLCRPLGLNATSTHDTKRGEDVRARLALLSELPELWAESVRGWSRRLPDFPDLPLEYLFHQTLFGAWPLSRERALAYLEKAAREAKTATSWTDPDPGFEARLRQAVQGAYGDRELMDSVAALARRLAGAAEVNGLAMKLLALTSPGVPDLYQGSEVWDLNLVDPDNRRPVDFERLSREAGGHPKRRLVAEALRLRPRFAGSDYRPLEAPPHLVAFARGSEAVVVVPRLWQRLGGYRRGQVELPPGRWVDVFGGGGFTGQAAAADLLAGFPVALLTPDEA